MVVVLRAQDSVRGPFSTGVFQVPFKATVEQLPGQ